MEREYEKKMDQLSKVTNNIQPVIELSEKDLENPEWNNNFNEWEYRRVRLKGRYIYGKGKINYILLLLN